MGRKSDYGFLFVQYYGGFTGLLSGRGARGIGQESKQHQDTGTAIVVDPWSLTFSERGECVEKKTNYEQIDSNIRVQKLPRFSVCTRLSEPLPSLMRLMPATC